MKKQVSKELPEIRKIVVLNAPIEKVWKAVSTSEGIAAWWMPNTFRPELGAHFTLHTDKFGDSQCVVTELVPPNLLGFDWDEDWHATFRLRDLGDGRTEFTLIHSGWPAAKKNRFGMSYSTVRDIMEGGWEKTVLVRLGEYVE